MKKTDCKKFQMDIVDYATGDATFLTPAKQDKLFGHLRQCAECRTKFFEYEHIFAAAAADKHTGKPAFQKKIKELLAGIRKPAVVAAGHASVDTKWEIGSAAGKVFKLLESNGEMPVALVRKKTGLLNYPFYEAVGWLAREEKVLLTKSAKGGYDSIRPRAQCNP